VNQTSFKRVILESPYVAKTPVQLARNIAYARAAMLDSLSRGEAPMVSHLLYTQVLDEENSHQRSLGIEAGLAWLSAASKSVVYTDLGISYGMRHGITLAESSGIPVEYRVLLGWVEAPLSASLHALAQTMLARAYKGLSDGKAEETP
jgi:hypothetical protein